MEMEKFTELQEKYAMVNWCAYKKMLEDTNFLEEDLYSAINAMTQGTFFFHNYNNQDRIPKHIELYDEVFKKIVSKNLEWKDVITRDDLSALINKMENRKTHFEMVEECIKNKFKRDTPGVDNYRRGVKFLIDRF